MSRLFSQTLRDAPGDAEVVSHKLLLRAGFIRQLGAGIFSYLPLARRSLTKIENIMRQEINAIGGQEITMPVVQPADLWQETGRWYQIGSEMGRFKDKSDHDMVLAMTHEEVVADLARREIRSWRQLPSLIYHIQTKWRDDPRPRAGLIRVREFTMLDSYSLDADFDGLAAQYRAHYAAYFRIFGRCGLPTIAVKSDTGMMGGKLAHEYMYLAPIGEDTLILCDGCGYTANRQVAAFRKPEPAPEAPRPVEKIATPHTSTIADLAKLLGVPESRTAKAVFMMAAGSAPLPPNPGGVSAPQSGGAGGAADERFIFAVIRGDMEVNETKLANAVGAAALRPATEVEILAVGATPGYASPVGLGGGTVGDRPEYDRAELVIVVDDLIPASPNLVAGANEDGYHLLNVNYGRDYQADIVCDIAAARDGDPCPQCSMALRTARGVEVGNIFQLGTRYTDALGATYLDREGKPRPVVMGSYGIGAGRLLACIAEEHNDANGLIWPVTVAPYHVHLVSLPGAEVEAEKLYADLWAAGIEVLHDDRSESAGVKFMDADLIGLPLRLTIGKRSLQAGGVELKRRDRAEKTIVPLDQVIERIKQEIAALEAEIANRPIQKSLEAE
ncbi:MAG: proline--tRNA ligase [Chloroflexi bacterium]|nr:proline--tRNA ligase [Chloroflexota bacterium]